MTDTKRNNSVKSIEIINYNDAEKIANRLNELVTADSKIVPFNSLQDEEGNLKNYGNDYDLYIIPQYDAVDKDKLSYYAVGAVPSFDSLIESEQGKGYLKTQFEIRTVKRIRDNIRLALADGRQFALATAINDFVAITRAGSGISEEFKKAVAELTKALQAKFAKLPQAKLLLTQKTVLTAINNEAFAKKYLPFTIQSNGESIFGKWLEIQIKKFNESGKPVNDLQAILDTRLTAELEEEEENENIELDDLF